MYPSIKRNTLFSEKGIEKIIGLPGEDHVYQSLLEVLTEFQHMKKFASEIHTETHLVKPILKMLGYAYESKPRFFENQVKDPDGALFSSEEDRVAGSKVWGTREYYRHVLSIVLLKRYGSHLHEGVSGFYLEFENRIPLYQIYYLLKKSGTPWGILTNGRYWILVKRPLYYEQKLVEVDLETPFLDGELTALHLFYRIFCRIGLEQDIPAILEEERKTLAEALREERTSIQKSLAHLKRRADIYPRVIGSYKQLFPDQRMPFSEEYLGTTACDWTNEASSGLTNIVKDHDSSDLSAYLYQKKGYATSISLESLVLDSGTGRLTKENLLALRILDLTPGFGNTAVQLVEGLAHLVFTLPYRERNTFVTEWENDKYLAEYIVDNMLYGTERSHLSLDILQNSMQMRFSARAKHYRVGNPLVGLSLRDLGAMLDTENPMPLFAKHPREVISEVRNMYKTYASLSARIKEDMAVREELEVTLKGYMDRIRDILDIMTASLFFKPFDKRKIHETIYAMDADESVWDVLRKKDWYLDVKAIARKNVFFHMEVEFPFLLNEAFDLIFVQPSLQYAWEEGIPLGEATKAYIKKGMAFLKGEGKLVVLLENPEEALLAELERSKKYAVEANKQQIVLTRKEPTSVP
jgi:hypothetical protein